MGLPMVQQVMERHSGSIEIITGDENGNSNPDGQKGTTVRLSFPVEGPLRGPTPKATAPDPSEFTALKVLVVDDEPMLRMVVEEMLNSEGHSTSVASGGPEAAEMVSAAHKASEAFDVVISDIEMPVLNGRMLAEIIETQSPDTEVILMTGWVDTRLDLDTISTRVVGLLKKPPRLADITALLSVVARNSVPVIPNDK